MFCESSVEVSSSSADVDEAALDTWLLVLGFLVFVGVERGVKFW